MSRRGELILMLIVGLIAGFGGAYAILFSSDANDSVWRHFWNGFRLTIGLIAVAAAISGFRGKNFRD